MHLLSAPFVFCPAPRPSPPAPRPPPSGRNPTPALDLSLCRSRTHTSRAVGGANSSVNSLGAGAAKLDRETDELKHRTVDKSLSKAIMQARLAKKMNQKQLGTAINEKPQVIQQYEAGKAIPNPQVISKLERALGCRLPRPKKAKKVKDDE
uniref:HTH cro/C1-type domain-containing protein n=1 Tax=Florenciella parvula TaxID=236787 RepID=A0A6T7BL95_9STRA|mmetsp:Transcript_13170/g.27840  ORF Transcript_13170/g.27840 Transcript_13170/m.27840 type:complete len:151 (+) Transcript_13170:497-949(+)